MSTPESSVDWSAYGAALFDLDGVVTPTAEVHMRAWSAMFNAFLEGHSDQAPYTDADYFDHVDGKPRYEGVADFLASRGLELPQGDPSDDPGAETVCGLGNRKNDAFSDVLRTEGVTAYPGSVALLDALRERGMPMAIVSSSRNAPAVLEAAGVTHYFATVDARWPGGGAWPAGQACSRHLRGGGRRPRCDARSSGGGRGRDQRRAGRSRR